MRLKYFAHTTYTHFLTALHLQNFISICTDIAIPFCHHRYTDGIVCSVLRRKERQLLPSIVVEVLQHRHVRGDMSASLLVLPVPLTTAFSMCLLCRFVSGTRPGGHPLGSPLDRHCRTSTFPGPTTVSYPLPPPLPSRSLTRHRQSVQHLLPSQAWHSPKVGHPPPCSSPKTGLTPSSMPSPPSWSRHDTPLLPFARCHLSLLCKERESEG